MGKVIWVRLETSDADAAQRFYQDVVGWGVERPDGAGEHRVLTAAGVGIGGIVPREPGATDLRWQGYVAVDDVDAEIAAVEAAGGRVTVPAIDLPMVGRIASVADPQGATYRIIAPVQWEDTPAAPSRQTPGQVGWHELHTPDMEAGFAFYAARYGWTLARDMDMGPMGTYRIFAIDGEDAGGIVQNTPLSPAWLHYFTVADIDASKAAIEAGGGTVTQGPHEVPGGAWIVHAIDPQGAVFALVGGRAA